jgi:phosphate:Na+ symporter
MPGAADSIYTKTLEVEAMTVSNIVELLGGLGAFLFGMKYMGDGLELAAGSKMKDLLEKLTRNKILGFLLGTFVTVVIQSSSATTVMVMGFINAGIMDLAQATGVIFGANIGTTITSILIALDVSAIAPFCICVGAFMMLYTKKARLKHIGQVILGFGLLFQGLHTMSAAMKPLGQVVWFQSFIMNAKNPILGILVGALICAVIQSSSAAVGIVQALALQGLMPLHFASYLICGINIGSAMPTILASMSARNNAKRAAMIYLIYNIVGCVVMAPVTMLTPYTDLIERLIPDPMFQVSVVHILFKVVAAAILLPCTNLVVKLTYKLIPKQKHEDAARLEFIDVNLVGNPSVSLLQIRSEVDRMAKLVEENLSLAMEGILAGEPRHAETITENEGVIDYLTDAISDYLVKFNVQELSATDANYVRRVFQALSDLERIGDYAEHLLHISERCTEKSLTYSDTARQEVTELYNNVKQLYSTAVARFHTQDLGIDSLKHLARLERENRKKTKQAQQNHMDRLRAGECSAEAGIMFGEVLTSLNRVGGHSINIAEAAVAQHQN